jgi:PRTRC genetic system protein B
MSFILQLRERTPVIQTVQALLLHARRNIEGGAPQSHWLTAHEVENREEGPYIGPGRLFTEGDKQALIETLLGTLAPEEFVVLPPQILAVGSQRIAWYVPGCVRAMYFNVNSTLFSLRVPWPTLIFRAVDGHLALTALSQSERPTADTPLFHAPLMNLNEATFLCIGNAEVPRGSSVADCVGYEKAVYETNFSHVNHDRTLKGAKTVTDEAHVHFWRTLQDKKAKRFPTYALVPLNKTLGQWLARRAS